MRFDLKVPFAEKDDAKRLGARWDPARKLWYVINPGDPGAFARWSPVAHEGAATTGAPAAPATRRPAAAGSAASGAPGKVLVGSRYVAHPAVCECPPWELCARCQPFALVG